MDLIKCGILLDLAAGAEAFNRRVKKRDLFG